MSMVSATLKTCTWTLDPEAEKPGQWKTWNKYGIKKCGIKKFSKYLKHVVL